MILDEEDKAELKIQLGKCLKNGKLVSDRVDDFLKEFEKLVVDRYDEILELEAQELEGKKREWIKREDEES